MELENLGRLRAGLQVPHDIAPPTVAHPIDIDLTAAWKHPPQAPASEPGKPNDFFKTGVDFEARRRPKPSESSLPPIPPDEAVIKPKVPKQFDRSGKTSSLREKVRKWLEWTKSRLSFWIANLKKSISRVFKINRRPFRPGAADNPTWSQWNQPAHVQQDQELLPYHKLDPQGSAQTKLTQTVARIHPDDTSSSSIRLAVDGNKLEAHEPIEPFSPKTLGASGMKVVENLNQMKLVPPTTLPPLPNRIAIEGLPGYSQSIKFIEPDGNCLFRAVSYLLTDNQEGSRFLREAAVSELRVNRQKYEPFISDEQGGGFEEYCENMLKDGTYGGNLEIEAMANLYMMDLAVVSKNENGISVAFHSAKAEEEPREWRLLYLTSEHYELLWRDSH